MLLSVDEPVPPAVVERIRQAASIGPSKSSNCEAPPRVRDPPHGRTVRAPHGSPLAGYPPRLRRVFFWFDSLSDWQRVQYAAIAIVFLLACGGYLLGLGSAVVLARVDAEQPELAAAPTPTEEPTQAPHAHRSARSSNRRADEHAGADGDPAATDARAHRDTRSARRSSPSRRPLRAWCPSRPRRPPAMSPRRRAPPRLPLARASSRPLPQRPRHRCAADRGPHRCAAAVVRHRCAARGAARHRPAGAQPTTRVQSRAHVRADPRRARPPRPRCSRPTGPTAAPTRASGQPHQLPADAAPPACAAPTDPCSERLPRG